MLSKADELLSTAVAALDIDARDEARVQILERTAAELGGYSFAWYQTLTPRGINSGIDGSMVEACGRQLVDVLKHIPTHSALALASLSSPPLSKSEQRRGGAYYTDWRLADFLARQLNVADRKQPLILDPASGTGILLVAAALALGKHRRRKMNRLIGDFLFAADLSRRALRGAALALSSLTGDRAAIKSLLTHLRCGDSLQSGAAMWKDVAPDGFDVVLGNPPWEKLKLSRHEFLVATGVDRNYGSDYGAICRQDFDREQQLVKMYAKGLQSDFCLQGSGEPDFYKLFVELALRLVSRDGIVALYVPAGLIRSLGTKRLRQFISDKCSDVSFTVLENRARFFPIDTRFKFVLLNLSVRECDGRKPFVICHAMGSEVGVKVIAPVTIERPMLANIRPDLSIPEVRTTAEWKLFRRLCIENRALGDQTGHWVPSLMREIDMTRDRGNFLHEPTADAVPVIEGRMIHQYRHAVKHYVAGRGRSAMWEPVAGGSKCEFKPQFWYPIEKLPANVQMRVETPRVGFCDITGQTNERTMLTARIPAGVVCGNKVPTVVFPFAGEHHHLLERCWLAIANSFLFDWLLRRVVTTTVNYFLLLGLPVPTLDFSSRRVKKIGLLVKQITACSHESKYGTMTRLSAWEEADIRAEIECHVLDLYGLGLKELRLILGDFPLLDRSQRPLSGERRSTITKDFVLWTVSRLRGGASAKDTRRWVSRVERAKACGSVPFVPSHLGDIQSEIPFNSLNEEGTHAPHNEEASSTVLSRSAAG
jgi:N-6 DNA Methylase